MILTYQFIAKIITAYQQYKKQNDADRDFEQLCDLFTYLNPKENATLPLTAHELLQTLHIVCAHYRKNYDNNYTHQLFKKLRLAFREEFDVRIHFKSINPVKTSHGEMRTNGLFERNVALLKEYHGFKSILADLISTLNKCGLKDDLIWDMLITHKEVNLFIRALEILSDLKQDSLIASNIAYLFFSKKPETAAHIVRMLAYHHSWFVIARQSLTPGQFDAINYQYAQILVEKKVNECITRLFNGMERYDFDHLFSQLINCCDSEEKQASIMAIKAFCWAEIDKEPQRHQFKAAQLRRVRLEQEYQHHCNNLLHEMREEQQTVQKNKVSGKLLARHARLFVPIPKVERHQPSLKPAIYPGKQSFR